MKKLLVIVTVLVFAASMVMPLMAQEGRKKTAPPPPQEQPGPPKPLDNAMMKFLVGEWEGSMESPMGPSSEVLRYWMGLDGQFLFMEGGSKVGNMKYSGIGAMTINPKSGDTVGYWIDNFRGMYQGVGKTEAGKNAMEWSGTMGRSLRILEKVSDDKFTVTVKMDGPDGREQTFKGEMTRKKTEKKK
jgi:hypothetical protein